jgi:hypothetical protein
MEKEALDFLNAGGGGGLGNEDFHIGRIFAKATTLAGEKDHAKLPAAGHFDGFENIAGFSAGRESHQDISGLAEGIDLPGKDIAEFVIIAYGGEETGIGGQSQGGVGAPVGIEAAGEFRGEVSGICGAAAIAAGEDFASAKQTFGQEIGGLRQGFFQGRQEVEEFAKLL